MDINISLVDALEKNDYANLIICIQDSIERLKTYWSNADFAGVEGEIEQKKSSLSFRVKKKLVEKNVDFAFGRYIGYVDASYEQLAKAYKEKSFNDSIEKYDISDIPHVNDIIITIKQDEGIRHGNLAEKVGIEKSTLSGIMDKLVEKGAIRFSRPGKYKYYYLTELGNSYYEKNKMIIEAETNIDALTEQLLLALSKEDDANGKLLQIISALCKGKNVFEGYKSKTKEKVNPSIVFAGIPTIRQLNVLFPDNSVHTINNGAVLSFNSKQSIIYLSDENKNDFAECSQLSILDIANV